MRHVSAPQQTFEPTVEKLNSCTQSETELFYKVIYYNIKKQNNWSQHLRRSCPSFLLPFLCLDLLFSLLNCISIHFNLIIKCYCFHFLLAVDNLRRLKILEIEADKVAPEESESNICGIMHMISD